MTSCRLLPRRAVVTAATVLLVVSGAGSAGATTQQAAPSAAPSAAAGAPGAGRAAAGSRACPPAALALGYSDALDQAAVGGVTLGGLSSLAYDRRSHAWASTVDNHLTDPSRIWFVRDLASPHVVRAPLVLRRPDGTPYDGVTADDEGLAVLPDGRYLVSSEVEPSIRVFGRDGVQQESLPVPARFAVTGTTPAGEATANATLEALTISPDGRTVVAAVEGALSGDVSATGDATLHRMLVYRDGPAGWTLRKQLAYRATTGERIPEVAAVGRHGLLVEEAAYDPATGNAVQLYAVPDYDRAPDVSGVADLSAAPSSSVLGKQLVADLVRCPTLGAPSKETQVNPLLDNYEGMAVTGVLPGRSGRGPVVGVSLISDDNFSDTQTTRVLNLAVRFPGRP